MSRFEVFTEHPRQHQRLRLRRHQLSFAAAWLAADVALAQMTAAERPGVIAGRIVDVESQRPVAGVTVTATGLDGRIEWNAATNERGTFRIPEMPPGTYALRFEVEDFHPYSRTGVQVAPESILYVEVAILSQTVTGEMATVTVHPVPASDAVVTVGGRRESLQTYSGTASALSEDQLSRVGIGNLREMGAMVPGLQIGVQEGNIEVYIRGIGSDNHGDLGDPAVALHLDGVYLPRPRGLGSMFFDIERVEVNSGPQGTLRGRNAVGGAVNIVSAQPRFGEFGANAQSTFGSFALRRYQGMLNAPLGDSLAVRVAAMSEVHDPYFVNAGPLHDIRSGEAADAFAYRVQAKWRPVPAFTALAAYDYTAERGTGYLGADFQGPPTLEGDNATPDDDTEDTPVPADIDRIDNPRRVYYRGMQPAVDMEHQGARLELTFDTGPVIFDTLGSYRDLSYHQVTGNSAGVVYPGYDYDAVSPDVYDGVYWDTTSQSFLAELRAYAPDSAGFRWTLGAFFFDETQRVFLGTTRDPADGFGGIEFNMPNVEAGSMAAYADGTFDIDEDLRVLGGARVTSEHKSRRKGLAALWTGFGNGGRFGTEGFRYAGEARTLFNLAPTASLEQRVEAFLNGIESFGARDEVPQSICADPPEPGLGEDEQPRVRPNGSGGLECSFGVHPNLLAREEAYRADPDENGQPFAISMTPQNDEVSSVYFDWRAGLEYDLAQDSLLYATVTTAHKAGGFGDTILDPATLEPRNLPRYDPESVLSLEIGSKNILAERRIRLNASAFFYRYSDQVFPTIVSIAGDQSLDARRDPTSALAVRQNVARSNVLGADLDFVYSLPGALEAEIHALLLDARFGDDVVVHDTRIGAGYRVQIGGNRLPRAPLLSVNYQLSQLLPTPMGVFHWLLSAQTRTTHYMSVFNGEGNLLPPVDGDAGIPFASYEELARAGGAAHLTDVVPTYTRFDIGGGWTNPDGRISIEGFVNNLTNLVYATSIISTPGSNVRFYDRPRVAGVRFRVDW